MAIPSKQSQEAFSLKRSCCIFLCVCTFFLGWMNQFLAAGEWKAGVAKAIITPEKPMWLGGYGGRTHPAEGKIHDIWVKALAIEDKSGVRAVLVTGDHIGFPGDMYRRIVYEVEKKYGIDRSRLMLTASHTHSGPVLENCLIDCYPLDAVQKVLITEYSVWFEKKVIETIGEALAHLEPATLTAGEGKATFAVNRRNNREAEIPKLIENGTTLKGPVDHTVPVLAVRASDGRLVAVVLGYACHNTTLSQYLWCGDYAGFAQVALEQAHPGTTAMFWAGCGADQNPLPRRSIPLCEKYGNQLATAVEDVLKGPMRSVGPRIRTVDKLVTLDFDKNPTREELVTTSKGKDVIRARWAGRMLEKLNSGATFDKTYPYPVQTWRLGDEVLWIALGGEVVIDYALRFSSEFGPGTWVTAYANDVMGYVPSKRVWTEGGYEAGVLFEYGYPAERWTSDVEDRIADSVHRLAKKIGTPAGTGADKTPSDNFVFETDTVRFVISTNGTSKSLSDKKTGEERLMEKPTAFATVRKAGQSFPATTVIRKGDLLCFGFGTSGVYADFRIKAYRHYLYVQLVRFYGNGIESFQFAQMRLKPMEKAGGWFAVRWDDKFTVALLGLSDCVNTTLGGEGLLLTSVYHEFGMEGQSVVILPSPTPRFLRAVQEVEHNYGLPSPKLGRQWAKTSRDVRTGYLFTDLTETNVDETIRYAKLGGFGYIMTYSGTWSSSLGSYPINTNNFPRGEASLKATIDKCHRAGLKVGMHMLTSFVGKNDPLVRPKPDQRLFKDEEATLLTDIDEKTKEITAAEPLTTFPMERAFYGSSKQGLDILIDDEIIQYRDIGGAGTNTFVKCIRGFAGTKAASHKSGTKIAHIAERYGCYLVDLKTSLKQELSERVAGVINRCGFDMIYFDGGECNGAIGPSWYWVSQQQKDICERVCRPLLAQGSGGTGWTWHWFSRGACDDFAAVAPKQYLDYHKIADSWRHYNNSFMPAELGWWGFLASAPHQPATSPDEVEFYAVRMLALDTPVSLETHLSALKSNGRTEEMLKLLGEYEKIRFRGKVSENVREKLSQGEWHLMNHKGKLLFQPISYDPVCLNVPGETCVRNEFTAQPLKFRLQCIPALASVGDKTNIVLLRSDLPLELKMPEPKSPMPGAMCGHIEFTKAVGDQTSVFMVGPNTQIAGGQEGKPLDLLRHRALAVKLVVEGASSSGTNEHAVLNVQLESAGKTYRDHYIDLNFTGERVVILPEPTTERMLPEFRPAHANYAFKAAMYGFNYKSIVALNLRWMRVPKSSVTCRLGSVEALAESDVILKNPVITIGNTKMILPAELKTGDYAEFWNNGIATIFDRNGVSLSTVIPSGVVPMIHGGDNKIIMHSDGSASAKLTLITVGEPLKP